MEHPFFNFEPSPWTQQKIRVLLEVSESFQDVAQLTVLQSLHQTNLLYKNDDSGKVFKHLDALLIATQDQSLTELKQTSIPQDFAEIKKALNFKEERCCRMLISGEDQFVLKCLKKNKCNRAKLNLILL